MATLLQRSATFRDVSQLRKTLLTLNDQRNLSQFCDVVLRVCGAQIFAHASVLAASSPYFSSFLGTGADSPRAFSQKQPQIIEIHIDSVLISEGDGGYGEAVGRVVEYMYTNEITITTNLFSQIIEIGRIMLLDRLLLFCEEFQKGSDGNIPKTVATCTSTLKEVVGILGNQSKGVKLADAQTETEEILFAKVTNEKEIESLPLSSSAFDLLFDDKINDINSSSHETKTDDMISSDYAKRQNESILFTMTNENTSKEDSIDGRKDVPMNKCPGSFSDTGKLVGPSTEIDNVEALATESEEPEENFNAIKSFEDILECNPISSQTTCGILESPENKPVQIQISEEKPSIPPETLPKTITEVELADISDLVTFDSFPSNASNLKRRGTGRPRGRPRKGKRGRPKGRREVERSTEYDAESDYEFEQFINKLEKGENVETQDDGCDTEHQQAGSSLHQSITEKLPMNVKKSNRIRSRPSQLKKDYVLHSLRRKTRKRYGSTLHDRTLHKMPPIEKDTDSKYSGLRFMCQKCDFSTTDFKTYMDHLNSHPELDSKRFQCPDCGFKTSKSRQLKRHKEKHMAEKLICVYCQYSALNATEYEEHMVKHTGTLPYFCSECDARFKKRSQWESHKPKHWVERPFICPVCKSGFKWKHALKNHMVTHTTVKEHLCDICGYATAHKSMLTAHQLVHTGETFKCSVEGCHFEGTKKQKLKMHMLTHTREKPHQCEVCGQRFSLAKNMRRHTLLHNNIRPIACKICSFTTTRYDKLKEHNQKSHNIGGPSASKKTQLEDILSPSEVTSTVTVVTAENITLNPDGTISAESLQKIAELAAAQQNSSITDGPPVKETIVNIERTTADGTTVPIMAHIQFSSEPVAEETEMKYLPEIE